MALTGVTNAQGPSSPANSMQTFLGTEIKINLKRFTNSLAF